MKSTTLRGLIRGHYGTIEVAAQVWGISRASIHKWLRQDVITYDGAQMIRGRGISLTGFPVETAPKKRGRPRLSRRRERP